MLSNLRLATRAYQREQYSGIDTPGVCHPEHFRQYPHAVSYQYNSRGFRDQEWPDRLEELKSAVWCVGDSFTVGIGQPYEHIWPQQLMQSCGQRTINVSMDGASNQWIARRAKQILDEIKPRHMVIMWSYWTRRELADATRPDEDRRLQHDGKLDFKIDAENFHICRQQVSSSHTQVLETIIPYFSHAVIDIQQAWQNIRRNDWPQHAPSTDQEFLTLPNSIKHEITHVHRCDQMFSDFFLAKNLTAGVLWCPQLDRARDGHHFDMITSEWLIGQLKPRLMW